MQFFFAQDIAGQKTYHAQYIQGICQLVQGVFKRSFYLIHHFIHVLFLFSAAFPPLRSSYRICTDYPPFLSVLVLTRMQSSSEQVQLYPYEQHTQPFSGAIAMFNNRSLPVCSPYPENTFTICPDLLLDTDGKFRLA